MGASRDLIVEHLRTRHPELGVSQGRTKAALRQEHAAAHEDGSDHEHPGAGNAFDRFAAENLIEGAA